MLRVFSNAWLRYGNWPVPEPTNDVVRSLMRYLCKSIDIGRPTKPVMGNELKQNPSTDLARICPGLFEIGYSIQIMEKPAFSSVIREV